MFTFKYWYIFPYFIDVDSDKLTSAAVVLSSPTIEEALNISMISNELTIIDLPHSIMLSSPSGVSLTIYEAVLRTVTYSNNREM